MPKMMEIATVSQPSAKWAAGASPVSMNWKLKFNVKYASTGTRKSLRKQFFQNSHPVAFSYGCCCCAVAFPPTSHDDKLIALLDTLSIIS